MSVHASKWRVATREEWLDASTRCGHATFFHTPMWAEIISGYLGPRLQPEAHTLTFSDGASAVVALCRQRLAGGLTRYVSSPAGNFGGWVSGEELGMEHVRAAVVHMGTYTNLIWRENPYDPLLSKVTLDCSTADFTQAVDLREGFDAVYARWSRGHVNAVNKARGAGTLVRRAESKDDWRGHFDSYRRLRRRWRKPSTDYGWKLFELLFERRSPHIVLWVAELDGVALSSVVCFYWNRHAVAWHAAAREEHFGVRPNHYMYFEIMRDAQRQGHQWFDMNPSGGNPGVVSFKQHFGAQELSSRLVVRRSGLLRGLHLVKRLCLGTSA